MGGYCAAWLASRLSFILSSLLASLLFLLLFYLPFLSSYSFFQKKILFFAFVVLGIKSRASHILGKPSTIELHPQPWEDILWAPAVCQMLWSNSEM